MSNQVHLLLQGKGGVGKSFVASLIVQFLRSRSRPVCAIDTDPVNSTLAGYKAFNVERLVLLEDGQLIERHFDRLMERILESDSDFVVDNGASTFIPLSYYIHENDVVKVIRGAGKQMVIHTLITGGQALLDTLNGFSALAEQIPEEVPIIVWLNEFFGDIASGDKTFEEMRAYRELRRGFGIPRVRSYGQVQAI